MVAMRRAFRSRLRSDIMASFSFFPNSRRSRSILFSMFASRMNGSTRCMKSYEGKKAATLPGVVRQVSTILLAMVWNMSSVRRSYSRTHPRRQAPGGFLPEMGKDSAGRRSGPTGRARPRTSPGGCSVPDMIREQRTRSKTAVDTREGSMNRVTIRAGCFPRTGPSSPEGMPVGQESDQVLDRVATSANEVPVHLVGDLRRSRRRTPTAGSRPTPPFPGKGRRQRCHVVQPPFQRFEDGTEPAVSGALLARLSISLVRTWLWFSMMRVGRLCPSSTTRIISSGLRAVRSSNVGQRHRTPDCSRTQRCPLRPAPSSPRDAGQAPTRMHILITSCT